MKRLLHLIEYALLRVVEAIVSIPSVDAAMEWGERIGLGLSRVMRRRDALIVSNLSLAFPEKSAAEIRGIADGVWRNVGRVAVEFMRADELLTPERVIVDGKDVFPEAAALGKGIVLVTPHFCNWEITGILLQRYAYQVVGIARAMSNPLADRWVRSKRSTVEVPVIPHRQAAKASFRLLRQNGCVGILCDQNLYKGGIFARFFGRPAATTTLPSLLHLRTGAPVVLAHTRREDGKYRLVLQRVTFPPVADEDGRVAAYTQHINDEFERIIRTRPEWWFWIHNRWKRSEEAES